MSLVRIERHRTIGAPSADVYEVLADYSVHHPNVMPPAHFSDLEVESGGVGEGTVFHITVKAGGKRQRLHMRVSEPEPGKVLCETNLDTGVVTQFTVSGNGSAASVLRMSSEWRPRRLLGWFDRLFTAPLTRRLFTEQLDQVDAYVRSLQTEPR
jgi:Polyketide cyclase / dehydrase and lipid transport